MTDEDWDLVTLVHLKGAYSCTKACWPIFRGQKVSLASLGDGETADERTVWTGDLRCFRGWAIWKCRTIKLLCCEKYVLLALMLSSALIIAVGLVALSKTISREGVKYNIKSNCIVPVSTRKLTSYVQWLIIPRSSPLRLCWRQFCPLIC